MTDLSLASSNCKPTQPTTIPLGLSFGQRERALRRGRMIRRWAETPSCVVYLPDFHHLSGFQMQGDRTIKNTYLA